MGSVDLPTISLATGIGGLDVGVSLAGWVLGFRTKALCRVEREAFAVANLVTKEEALKWMRHLSGPTSRHSQKSLTAYVAKWASSLPDFPVSHSLVPGSVKGKRTSATSGLTSSTSSKPVSPPWCFSRTSQIFLPGLSPSGSGYASWATRLKQESSRRLRLAEATCGSDSSRWGTPSSSDMTGTSGGGQGKSLRTDVKRWPTVKTPTGGSEARDSRARRGAGGEDIGASVQRWATPRKNEFGSEPEERKGPQLISMAQRFHLFRETLKAGPESSQQGQQPRILQLMQ